ncbi:hypothetical protein K435DRAFT_794771 [Dendrothele bispora CBS 962.96]|uniref:DUF6532 domain-containing protein n=1 Tax=Dendrothele bispora (strain CBS 962.96) TaxID=1314807 RepID=A0A4S8MAZ6_DENBC|nr:hypothetical protein K435DRAFT_794771 [Dendrothele bispora CBS 962.96]
MLACFLVLYSLILFLHPFCLLVRSPSILEINEDSEEEDISKSLPINARASLKATQGQAKDAKSSRGKAPAKPLKAAGPGNAKHLLPTPKDDSAGNRKSLMLRDRGRADDEGSGEENESEKDKSSEEETDNSDEENEGRGNEMIVEEKVKQVIMKDKRTSSSKPRHSQRKNAGKITLEEFGDADEQELAQLARRVARMYTAFDDMYPRNGVVIWPRFVEYLSKRGDKTVNEVFERVANNNGKKALLVRWMKYGAVDQYRVDFLQEKRRFHHGDINFEEETYNNLAPFRNPLLALVLRESYLVSNCEPNELLVDLLHEKRAVPLGLIAMAAAIVNHILTEVSMGVHVRLTLKAENVVYRLMVETLQGIEKYSPSYFRMLSKSLYKDMNATSEPVTVDTYDYTKLEGIAAAAGNWSSDENDGSDG